MIFLTTQVPALLSWQWQATMLNRDHVPCTTLMDHIPDKPRNNHTDQWLSLSPIGFITTSDPF
jgi:hypothetical protein